ncbi:MAG: DciA family protein [Xanthomonadales bacterium]|jgi:hypothetical protein|nr:DciA family protein [Xanthomonadales bacterium]
MVDSRRKSETGAQSVSEIAGADARGLGRLLGRARHLDRLDRLVAGELDPRHAPHVRVANLRQGVLILATPVAPIAQRIRMETPRLLTAIQAAFPGEVESLEVRITPDLPPRIQL